MQLNKNVPKIKKMFQPIAKGMGLDTTVPTTLWKDKAQTEASVAVLYSFQVFKIRLNILCTDIYFFAFIRNNLLDSQNT